MGNLQDDPESYAVIGAAMEVHNELGHGYLEPNYQNTMNKELGLQNIPCQREKRYVVNYKGECIGEYFADFLCFESLIVELKALPALTSKEEAQVINYLKASGNRRGLLLNFGAPSLQWKRLVFGEE